MNVLELYSGTESISEAFRKKGHDAFTIDNNLALDPDLCTDIVELDFSDVLRESFNLAGIDDFDIVWASPPCTTFSVCTISRHWKNGRPKTPEAKAGIEMVLRALQLIKALQPKYWFIENPRGMLRKVMPQLMKKAGIQQYRRVTVTYCQYGDRAMKPTDIWTNCHRWNAKPACKAGMPCHDPAPRGSSNGGIQGKSCAKERGRIPDELCDEIVQVCSGEQTGTYQDTLNV